MLTMYPYTSGRLARIVALEHLIKYIRSHQGVEFMRCLGCGSGLDGQGPAA